MPQTLLWPVLLLVATPSFGAGGAAPTPETEVPPPATPEAQVWVGTLAVFGSKKIPLLGKVEFRTDTHVLAHVTKIDDKRYTVRQNTCSVTFPKTMGAEVTLDPTAPAKMPEATFEWLVDDAGEWTAGPWDSGWDDKDHDEDGQPGISFHVAAPFCGGDLYISSQASQTATGRPSPGLVVRGDLRIFVIQDILGARGPCLNLMSRDSEEWMDGKFSFARGTVDDTCETVENWPDPMEGLDP